MRDGIWVNIIIFNSLVFILMCMREKIIPSYPRFAQGKVKFLKMNTFNEKYYLNNTIDNI